MQVASVAPRRAVVKKKTRHAVSLQFPQGEKGMMYLKMEKEKNEREKTK